jgi:Uma2 family endonuclease
MSYGSCYFSLEEFLDWYPDGYGRYELWNGAIVEMQSTGFHEQVGAFWVPS